MPPFGTFGNLTKGGELKDFLAQGCHVILLSGHVCVICSKGLVIKYRGDGYEKLGVGHNFSTCLKGWVRQNNALHLRWVNWLNYSFNY